MQDAGDKNNDRVGGFSFATEQNLMLIAQYRTAKQLECDATLPGNLGCGVAAPDKKSYGKEFNQAGGGFYIMERTPTVINAWFFSRGANVSTAITTGAQTLDTATLVSKPLGNHSARS